ncbi:DUF3010 family protein [Marinobacter salinexigens]|uniref:DUF3010 family protein n=1 Tax=Marinobacter salinexigens TaxID=2919747 RepID=A0A5B0VN24_9GAMM|nr:DUF3010 family protein [Marinobacter salinexigens]KAA1176102.1 DUF3010 family protein [Marinobacter salinexigens]
MNVCGVELTGSDAVLCFLNLDRGQFNLPDSKVRKVTLPKNHSRDDLKQFQESFAGLMADNAVNRVVIKERMQKGKFAGGAVSFKLEAAIQLIGSPDLEVSLVSPAQIKSTLAANPLPIPFVETGLKAFQETAFVTAYVGQMTK